MKYPESNTDWVDQLVVIDLSERLHFEPSKHCLYFDYFFYSKNFLNHLMNVELGFIRTGFPGQDYRPGYKTSRTRFPIRFPAFPEA